MPRKPHMPCLCIATAVNQQALQQPPRYMWIRNTHIHTHAHLRTHTTILMAIWISGWSHSLMVSKKTADFWSTRSSIFFRLDVLPDIQRTVSRHWSQMNQKGIQKYSTNGKIPWRLCLRHWQLPLVHSTYQWQSLARQTAVLLLWSYVDTCRLQVRYTTNTRSTL